MGAKAMGRYREAIFRYAILINVLLALYVILRSSYAIGEYYSALDSYTRWVASDRGEYGFDYPVRPPNHFLVFAWAVLVQAIILAAATIFSIWRSYAWLDWTRIFAFLAIWFVVWLEGLSVLSFIFDLVPPWKWHIIWVALKALLGPVLACLWLVYNLKYRALVTRA